MRSFAIGCRLYRRLHTKIWAPTHVSLHAQGAVARFGHLGGEHCDGTRGPTEAVFLTEAFSRRTHTDPCSVDSIARLRGPLCSHCCIQRSRANLLSQGSCTVGRAFLRAL